MSRVIHSMFILGFAVSCQPSEPRAFQVPMGFLVESDPGTRVAGATVFAGARAVGVSDASGSLSVDVAVTPGEPVLVDVRCPAGFSRLGEPKVITASRFGRKDAGQPRIEVTLRCKPEQRVAVFVIRAGVGQLPILLDGKRVSTTNDFGVAHFSVRSAPGTEYAVTFDTSGTPELRPQFPIHHRGLADSDEIFVLTQAFETPARTRGRGVRRRRITKIE